MYCVVLYKASFRRIVEQVTAFAVPHTDLPHLGQVAVYLKGIDCGHNTIPVCRAVEVGKAFAVVDAVFVQHVR